MSNFPDSYASALAAMGSALATGDFTQVSNLNPDDKQDHLIRLYVETNWVKRAGKLMAHLWLVDRHVAGLADKVAAYVKMHPQRAYHTVSDDAIEFLAELEKNEDMSAEQRDAIVCQCAYAEVARRAHVHRRAFLRFQECYSVSEYLLERPDVVDPLLLVNPSVVWKTLHTRALIGTNAKPPCNVGFFAVGDDIRSAVLRAKPFELFLQLSAMAPVRRQSWSVASAIDDADSATEFVGQMTKLGLTALA